MCAPSNLPLSQPTPVRHASPLSSDSRESRPLHGNSHATPSSAQVKHIYSCGVYVLLTSHQDRPMPLLSLGSCCPLCVMAKCSCVPSVTSSPPGALWLYWVTLHNVVIFKEHAFCSTAYLCVCVLTMCPVPSTRRNGHHQTLFIDYSLL